MPYVIARCTHPDATAEYWAQGRDTTPLGEWTPDLPLRRVYPTRAGAQAVVDRLAPGAATIETLPDEQIMAHIAQDAGPLLTDAERYALAQDVTEFADEGGLLSAGMAWAETLRQIGGVANAPAYARLAVARFAYQGRRGGR